MEKIDLNKLDQELLATVKVDSPAAMIENSIKRTSELMLQEREQGLQQVLRSAILLESQLRLRIMAHNLDCSKLMASATSTKGLCSIEVIMRSLEEPISSKEIYILSMIRVQQSLGLNLQSKSDLLKNVQTIKKVKNDLDKLPFLRSAFIESLYAEYLLNKKDKHLLSMALELGSGSNQSIDVLFCSLSLCKIIEDSTLISPK